MPLITAGHQVGLDDDADVGGVELVIDHRPVADKTADADIAFDQRRQAVAAAARVEFNSSKAVSGSKASRGSIFIST